MPRKHFHFLGKASWPAKNVRGAINVAWDAGVPLAVLGGDRLNFSRGFRFTWSPSIHFYGMVGGREKFTALNQSKGLIFPVRWYEPFGLAIIESLYFGAPVFATPYGSLSELIGTDVGFLSNSRSALAEAVKTMHFDPRRCHEYAREKYTAAIMGREYVKIYERVLNGEKLNKARPELIDRNVNKLPWLA
jgi:glycosyltransferase involved in cell wall biosynthesis